MNAIQVSGGVDSTAMLWYLRDVWKDSVVMWCDTGSAYPETQEYMSRVKKIVPNFRTIYGNQPAVIEAAGYPVDVVPVRFSLQGEQGYGKQEVRFQSYYDCCRQSIWEPMQRVCVLMGIDTIYRGQRKTDVPRAPIESGHRDSFGIQYIFPIQDWSKRDCFDYVQSECPEFMPDYYDQGEVSSRDCWNCTAYLDQNIRRIHNLPENQRSVVNHVLGIWKDCVKQEMR